MKQHEQQKPKDADCVSHLSSQRWGIVDRREEQQFVAIFGKI